MKTPQEIKQTLEQCSHNKCAKCVYFRDGCASRLMRDALEYINELEARAPMWISVSEKLPTPDTRVIASAIDNYGESIVVITEYTHRLYGLGMTGWIEPWQYFSCDYKITHWMPLPEAPKEGE